MQLKDVSEISEETSLINLLGIISEICKSALFEISLRHCIRHLEDASEMHPCRMGLPLRFLPIMVTLEVMLKQRLLLQNKFMQIFQTLTCCEILIKTF